MDVGEMRRGSSDRVCFAEGSAAEEIVVGAGGMAFLVTVDGGSGRGGADRTVGDMTTGERLGGDELLNSDETPAQHRESALLDAVDFLLGHADDRRDLGRCVRATTDSVAKVSTSCSSRGSSRKA